MATKINTNSSMYINKNNPNLSSPTGLIQSSYHFSCEYFCYAVPFVSINKKCLATKQFWRRDLNFKELVVVGWPAAQSANSAQGESSKFVLDWENWASSTDSDVDDIWIIKQIFLFDISTYSHELSSFFWKCNILWQIEY